DRMSAPSSERLELLIATMRERILCLDGAMGTALFARNLTEVDYGGPEFHGCPEHLNITRPDVIRDIHRAYGEAGADSFARNTSGSPPPVPDEFRLGPRAIGISRIAAKLGREVADAMSTPDKPRFVAGSMGPTTRAISVTGGATFEEMIGHYRAQAQGLVEG